MKRIEFNVTGYDPFIDFLKGFCILSVVLTHCLPMQDEILFPFWGGQAVPVFLLIQVFHTYKKGLVNLPIPNYRKIFDRILKPFIFQVSILFVFLVLFSSKPFLEIIKSILFAGGIGPGSYYVWIYIQFIFLTYITSYIIKFIKNQSGVFLFFVGISIIFEIICSYTNIRGGIYRLLFFRYYFLIYLGYMWIKKGIQMNITNIIFSIISIVFIYLLQYREVKLEPFFFDSWRYYHWICYFYTANLFIYIIHIIYNNLNYRIIHLFKMLGKYSFDIYLFQMVIFTIINPQELSFINYVPLRDIVFVIITTLGSIVPVIVYKQLKEKYI